MATVTKPIALDESFNTTEVTPRNIADVLAEGLSHITGRTASEVEYDNTESGLTADNVQDALDEIAESVPTLPSVDIQTAVDEFSTYNGGLLSECKVTLSPNQDLHGYPNPWVGGAGKNKFDKNGNLENGKFIQANGTLASSTNWNTTDYQQITPDTYTMSGATEGEGGYYGICWYDSEKTYISGFQRFTTSPQTVTIPNNAKYVRYSVNNSSLDSFMLEQGSTATAYEPYENICPISGHTQVDVQNHQKNLIDWKVNATSSPWNGIFESGNYVISAESTLADGNWYFRFTDANGEYSYTKEECGLGSFTKASSGWVYGGSTYQAIPFTVPNGCTLIEIGKMNADGTIPAQVEEGSTATPYEPYNGYQVTVNLGGTYYSGTLDVVTGVFTPDTAKYVLTDVSKLEEFSTSAQYGAFAKIKPSEYPSIKEDISLELSSSCKAVLYVNRTTDIYDNRFYINDINRVYIRASVDENVTTVNELFAIFENCEFILPLANPTPIQLSPTMVKALVGENHLSAPLEGQEITESKYKQTFTFDDVIAYIQSLS